MAMLMAVTALVCAIVAVLTAAILVPGTPAPLFAGAVALAGGIVLLLQRTLAGWVGGGVVLVLAILGILGNIGAVSTEGGGGADFGISAQYGSAFLVAALVLVPAAAVWATWGTLAPWGAYVGLGAAAIAVIVALAAADQLVDQNKPVTWIVAILALATMAPAILLLRTPVVTHRETVADEPAGKPVGRKTAKRKVD